MQMMAQMLGMMAGMGLIWVLVVVVIALAAVYLTKRIFFDDSRWRNDD